MDRFVYHLGTLAAYQKRKQLNINIHVFLLINIELEFWWNYRSEIYEKIKI